MTSPSQLLYSLQAQEKAKALAEDVMFAAAWQERVKELKQEEGAEAADRLAKVRTQF